VNLDTHIEDAAGMNKPVAAIGEWILARSASHYDK